MSAATSTEALDLNKKQINPALIKKAKRGGLITDIRENTTSYLMMTPFLLLFLVFIVIPVVVSIVLSLFYYNVISTPSWVGWDNFKRLFLDDDIFGIAVKNTLVFAIITGPVSYFLCLIFAWLVNELSPKVRALATFMFYVPSMCGNAIFIFQYMFSGDAYGLLNGWLMKLGMINSPVLWLKDPSYMLAICMIVQLWMSLGTGFLVFIAGLQGIDKEMYEAAAIDGATTMQRIFKITTLPSMKPQLKLGAVLQITGSFAVSGICSSLCGFPSPLYAAHTVVLHMEDYGTTRYEMGYALAIAVVLFLVTVITSRLILKLLKEKTY